MTQSDDNRGRDNAGSKYLGDKIVERSVRIQGVDNEIGCVKESDPASASATHGLKGSSDLVNLSGEMGSTDSAGNTHSSGSSCGFVSSLFPNSCRGRAESFARRLHRRLTSLGGEGGSGTEDEDDDALTFGARGTSKKISESSWLHGSTGQKKSTAITVPVNSSTSGGFQMEGRVLDSQPRHSPESDVYYDFDVDHNETGRRPGLDEASSEDYGTTSPAEIAAEAEIANIFVNRKKTNNSRYEQSGIARSPDDLRDSEGCVYASPLSGTSPETDNSEIFFDPESSETERTCENDESERLDEESEPLVKEMTLNLDDAISSKIRKPKRRLRSRGSKEPEDDVDDDDVDDDDDDDADDDDADDADDDDETESSLCDPDLDLEARTVTRTVSSEESLNGGKSSIETTTSPSHESLWSTFDESTLSIQEESSTAPISSTLITPRCERNAIVKSHSDSELIRTPSRSSDEIDEVDHAVTRPLTNGDHTCLVINDVPDSEESEISAKRTILTPEENLKNQANLRCEETNDSDGDMSRLLERLARNPHINKSEPLHQRKLLSIASEEEKDVSNENDLQERKVESEKNGEAIDEEEGEEEEEGGNNRPQRLRRCSSLKTGKTPPGTPGRKKIVRFADVLGLDLADVRTFLDEIPKIPNSAYSDLIYDDVFQKDSSHVNFWGTGPATFTTPLYAATMPRGLPNGVKVDRILVPLFQQPGGSLSFLDQVRERQVCLENVLVEDPVNMSLHGTVRVRNLDFHKSVHIRYTLDSWRNFSDLQATYVPNSCDGFSDKFTFHLYCHTLKLGQRLELAVRFQCKGAQYWDNNGGFNYCFQCLPATSSNAGYVPITVPTIVTTAASPPMSQRHNHDWLPTFY